MYCPGLVLLLDFLLLIFIIVIIIIIVIVVVTLDVDYHAHRTCLDATLKNPSTCLTYHPQVLPAALITSDGLEYSDSRYNLRARFDVMYHDFFRRLYAARYYYTGTLLQSDIRAQFVDLCQPVVWDIDIDKQAFIDIRLRPSIATPFMAVAARVTVETFRRRAHYGQT